MGYFPGDLRFWQKHFDDVAHVVVYPFGKVVMLNEDEPKAGVGIFFGCGHLLNMSLDYKGRQTREAANLVAVIMALRTIRRNSTRRHVELRVNCSYLIDIACLKGLKWIWSRGGMQDGKPMPNLNLLRELFEELNFFENVLFTYVNEKTGGRGLALAYDLAVNAVDQYKEETKRAKAGQNGTDKDKTMAGASGMVKGETEAGKNESVQDKTEAGKNDSSETKTKVSVPRVVDDGGNMSKSLSAGIKVKKVSGWWTLLQGPKF